MRFILTCLLLIVVAPSKPNALWDSTGPCLDWQFWQAEQTKFWEDYYRSVK